MAESEFIIIGGGIAGASTAYHLAREGHDVTLLERGEIAGEASGVNAGSIGAMGWGNSPNLQSHLTMGSLEISKAWSSIRVTTSSSELPAPFRQFSRNSNTSSSATGYCC